MKPWHIYFKGAGSRAFVRPKTRLQVVILWFRGWRPFYLANWWTKARLRAAVEVTTEIGNP